MPIGPRISPAEAKEWLRAWERGERIDTLARKAGRTERTVKEHIRRARLEEDHKEVRVELLKDAYLRHYADLIDVAEKLRKRAGKPDPEGLWASLDDRTEMLRKALQSHTSRLGLWKAAKKWDEHAQRINDIEEELKEVVTTFVAKLRREYPEVIEEEWVKSILFALREIAAGRDPSYLTYQTEVAAVGMALKWGAYGLAASISDESRAGEVKKKHERLLKSETASESDRLIRLQESMVAWEKAKDHIQSQVDTLVLRRVLPGQCNLCPAIEDATIRPFGDRRRRR